MAGVDDKRELLQTWNLLRQRENDLLWKVPRMSEEEVESACGELLGLVDRINDLADEIENEDVVA